MRDNGDLTHDLMDKTYAGMDGDFYEFLYNNASKICVHEELPPNADILIKNSSEIEYKDKDLQQLMDTMLYQSIEEKNIEAINIFDNIPLEELPLDLQQYISEGIQKLSLRFCIKS